MELLAKLSLIICCCDAVSRTLAATQIPDRSCIGYYKPGDYIIGGIFPIYRSATAPCNGVLFEPGVSMAESMLFAVNKINERSDILRNITLGVELRNDCSDEGLSLWTIGTMLSPVGHLEYKEACPGRERGHERQVFGVVGTSRSSTSLFAAKVGGVYRVPLISYTATSDELSNAARFPYFLRTVPPDKFQAIAIVDILLRFNWTYVALFYSIDTYGVHGARHVRTLAENAGICVAVNFPVTGLGSKSDAQDIVSKLREANKANVIVIISYRTSANEVLRAIQNSNLNKHYTFVGSDGWGSSLVGEGFAELVHGGIFVRLYSGMDQDFRDHYNELPTKADGATHWYRDLLDIFAETNNCSDWSVCPKPQPVLELLVTTAVYAFAHALNDSLSSRACNAECEDDGETLLQNLLSVSFDTQEGPFRFDANGDTSGKYFYKNFQKVADAEEKYELATVGVWQQDNLTIDTDAIQWGLTLESDVTMTPPSSVCRDVCRPGYITVPLRQKCCLGCMKCEDFSIVLNSSTACSACPDTHWPNGEFTHCVPIKPTFLDLTEVMILVILVFSVFGLFLGLFAAAGMWHYRGHPLIKATSRELSAVNITGLILCFTAPFLMIIPKPTYVTCALSEICIVLCLTFNFAPTLLKVNRIWRIFQSGKKSNKKPRFVGPKQQLIIVGGVIVIEVMYFLVDTLVFVFSKF